MAWDEWEQIKADVAERNTPAMQLNGLPPDETGPSVSTVTKGLKSSRQAWLAAGEGVGSLRKGVTTALGKLENGQSGLGETSGCLSAAAQKELYASWQKYADEVSRRCGSLQGILEKVGRDLLLSDEAVRAEVDKVRAEFADRDDIACVPRER
ncbi:hypothetical protein [Streptomyces qinzhouensis]|uniref:Uncharacterized protein n=1 Tax=Streptomyces qinzhouensis TaxID=2599401 RepID=A0A5B8JEQ4_9ACTN|nr:hypothetical protein [Streptomyces qinzhouensis]QDY78734.1 hypothetical protein FQU76_21950 [Streptomyces qinzhouensis]